MRFQRHLFLFLTFCFCILASFTPPNALADETFNEVVFIRLDTTYPIFNQYEDALRKAADDLNIEVKVYTIDPDPYELVQVIQQLARAENKTDLIITMASGHVGETLIKILHTANIEIALVNMELSEKNRKSTGAPREIYKNWIASMAPDYEEAGQRLGEYLYRRAKEKKLRTNWKVNMCAIHGIEGIRASMESINGVLQAQQQHDDLLINDILEGYWTTDKAQKVAADHLFRHPETNALWVINDPAVIGVVKAAEENGLTPGKDIIIGGMNWHPDIFDYIKDGRVEVSIGGHFMDTAWLLLLAYDYHHGHDFMPYIGTEIKSSMQMIDKENVDIYADIIGNEPWEKIDFKSLTQTHNPQWNGYNFNLLKLLAPSQINQKN